MDGSFVVSVVWLLCMLAAVAHGARRVATATDVLQLALPFVLTFAAALYLTPQPSWIGFLAAVLATWRLIHRGSAGVDRVLGGVSAGMAGALYAGHGLEPWIAGAISAAVLAAGVWLTQSPKAAPGQAREVALVTVAIGATLAALTPEIAAGWHAAGVLNHAAAPVAGSAQGQSIPAWTVAFAALALLAGAVRGLWVRK